MRASRMNLVPLREEPNEGEITSHRLLVCGGFLNKCGDDLYSYTTLLKRVMDKVTRISPCFQLMMLPFAGWDLRPS